MAVDVVLDGNDALDHLALTRYDVVVLDRDLPGVHGDEVCRRLVSERSESRVLMLTAASTSSATSDSATTTGTGLVSRSSMPSRAPTVARSSHVPDPKVVSTSR